MTKTATALKAANANMNATLPHLDAIVDASRANQTKYDQAYNAALTLYNSATSQHEKAQDQYNLDNGSLVNIQKECAQPIKPPNCAQLIADAKKQIATDSSNLENTQEAIKVAQTKLSSAKVDLADATALYWAAVKDKSNAVAALQLAINTAITNQQQAVEQYEEVVAECK